MDAEEIVRIAPEGDGPPAGEAGESLKAADRELVGIFRMDGLACPEGEASSRRPHRLVAKACKMHLDAVGAVIVADQMAKAREIEIAVELVVDAAKKVLVE